MKIKYVVSIIIVVLSFFITEEVLTFLDSKNPIMQNIKEVADDYEVSFVNAIVNDNTIIPGINGKEVNIPKSFHKMDNFGAFNDYYFVYNEVSPEISLENNKDKIIIKGNPKKRCVSFIIDKNIDVENYLVNNNIKYDKLIYYNDSYQKDKEYINAESNKDNFFYLNILLKKRKINSNICLINYSNYESCINNKNYIVNYSLMATNNIINTINNINSGDIIFISDNLSVDNIKLLLNEIKKIDLKIVYLSNLISE